MRCMGGVKQGMHGCMHVCMCAHTDVRSCRCRESFQKREQEYHNHKSSTKTPSKRLSSIGLVVDTHWLPKHLDVLAVVPGVCFFVGNVCVVVFQSQQTTQDFMCTRCPSTIQVNTGCCPDTLYYYPASIRLTHFHRICIQVDVRNL